MGVVHRRRRPEKKKWIRIVIIVFCVLLLFFFIRLRNSALHFFAGISLRPLANPTSSPLPTLTVVPTSTPTPSPTPLPTPTLIPTPTFTPTPMPSTPFESYFDEYSAKYQISKDMLKKIAFCESGVSPGAVNGPYGGMFQFTMETWKVTREQMGADPSADLRFGAKEAIETAAFKISRGGIDAWKNCAK